MYIGLCRMVILGEPQHGQRMALFQIIFKRTVTLW